MPSYLRRHHRAPLHVLTVLGMPFLNGALPDASQPGWLIPGTGSGWQQSGSPSLPSPLLPCSEGSGLSWSWILSLSARKIKSIFALLGLLRRSLGLTAFAAKPSSLIFLCWDVSPGSQISHSSALPAASLSHAYPARIPRVAGSRVLAAQPQSTARHRAQQRGTCACSPPCCLQKSGSSGERQRRRLPCRDCSGSGQTDAEALPAFLLVWSHSTGVESREVHACKNQCEGINQAESERLKKSRGSGVMCVIERGFLYLHRPPRLPSCQGKPAKAETFRTPKQIVVCWMGAL